MKKFEFNTDTQPSYGFCFPLFLNAFNQTFNQSSYNKFSRFFTDNSDLKKWMIFSDYVLGDKNKSNDVITFSFVPYAVHIDKFKIALDNLCRDDIKNLKRVDKKFINFINDFPIFNISIILSKKRKLCFNDEVNFFITKNEMAIKQLSLWCKSTPENEAHYNEIIAKLKIVNSEVKKKGANLKIVRNIEIISSLAAYLIFEMSRIVKPEKVGWFSDRDDVINYKSSKIGSPLIYDLVDNYHYLLCQDDGSYDLARPLMGVPEKTGELWYDQMLRIPDCICGSIADLDMKLNKITHPKFTDVLECVVASSDKHLLFKIDFDRKGFGASYLPVKRC